MCLIKLQQDVFICFAQPQNSSLLISFISFVSFSSFLQGHTDELWGLAIHPWKPQFLTCGYDRQVCLWDSSSHQLIWSKSLEVSLGNTGPWGQSLELHSKHMKIIFMSIRINRTSSSKSACTHLQQSYQHNIIYTLYKFGLFELLITLKIPSKYIS